MGSRPTDPVALRAYRNRALYRPIARIHRVYNRWLIEQLHARGHADFSPSFPSMLSNLDTEGTRIGVLAARAGVSRQAAGQLLSEIEAAGYVKRRADTDDRRATVVAFTDKGRRVLAAIFELVDEFEGNLVGFVSKTELAQVRRALVMIADGLDPMGVLGHGDRSGSEE